MTCVSPIPGYDVIEVFVYYDGAKLFSCGDVTGQTHLAYWIEDSDSLDRWFVVPVSKTRLRAIRIGSIGLQEAIGNPEAGRLYEYRIPHSGDAPRIHLVMPDQIEAADLPTSDARLALADRDNLPELHTDVKQHASQSLRDVLDMELETVLHRQELPASFLGAFLTRLQSLVNSIANETGKRGPIPKKVRDANSLRVVQFFAGSFGVRFESSTPGGLWEDTRGNEAFPKLIQLFEARDDRNRLGEVSSRMRAMTVARYRLLLGCVVAAGSSLAADWASPHGERSRIEMNHQQLSRAFDILAARGDEMMDEYKIAGTLVALDTDRHTFKFVSEDGTQYMGEVASELRKTIFRLPVMYTATIEETLEVNADTQEERIRYRLLDLEGQASG